MFVDIVEISVLAGNGGDGRVSFRHEKFVDKGGPDGGDGGNGGDVIVVASRNKNTLAEFRFKKRVVAEHGIPGDKRNKKGKTAKNLYIDLPIGTIIKDVNTNEIIADLTEDGQSAVIAKGGKGGFGNAHFKSSTRQAPRLAEKGEEGERKTVLLEMRMVADVGLIGMPNAGKSTFLSVVSSAKPDIGNYAFTTLVPNLGVADIDGVSLLIADIPGLIEGASQGKGLGDEFLRHVSRCKILLHLIDSTSDDAASIYTTIQNELMAHSKELAKKPQILVLTKAELVDEDIINMQKELLSSVLPKTRKVSAISSQSQTGLKELLRITAKEVLKAKAKEEKLKQAKANELTVITLAPDVKAWTVTKLDDNKYLVKGKKIELFTKKTNFKQRDGVARLRDILRKMGISRELVKMGINPGDKIIIGDPSCGELEY